MRNEGSKRRQGAFLGALVAVTLLAATALAGDRQYAPPPKYEHDGITVTTTSIKNDGKKIWFKLIVINGTGKPLIVDRNQMQVKWPDGSLHSREVGTFAGPGSPYNIAPGMSHDVFVEFKVPSRDVPKVDLQMKGFLVDAKPVTLPDFVATIQ